MHNILPENRISFVILRMSARPLKLNLKAKYLTNYQKRGIDKCKI